MCVYTYQEVAVICAILAGDGHAHPLIVEILSRVLLCNGKTSVTNLSHHKVRFSTATRT